MTFLSRLKHPAILITCAVMLSACNENGTTRDWSTAMAARGAKTSALLSWQAPSENTDGTPLTDISGYHIYVGTDPNGLTATTELTDTNITSYRVSHLTPGTWYFAISAYNSTGAEGELSNIGSKTII